MPPSQLLLLLNAHECVTDYWPCSVSSRDVGRPEGLPRARGKQPAQGPMKRSPTGPLLSVPYSIPRSSSAPDVRGQFLHVEGRNKLRWGLAVPAALCCPPSTCLGGAASPSSPPRSMFLLTVYIATVLLWQFVNPCHLACLSLYITCNMCPCL